jgi:hypothetical protein
MTAEKKLAHQRLSLLELANALGSVSEACRRRGVSRTRFYEYKRRFQTHGIEGLKDLPPIAKSHPMTVSPRPLKRFAGHLPNAVPYTDRSASADSGLLEHRIAGSASLAAILNRLGEV